MAKAPVRCRPLDAPGEVPEAAAPRFALCRGASQGFSVEKKKDVLDILFHGSFTCSPELLKNANVESLKSNPDRL